MSLHLAVRVPSNPEWEDVQFKPDWQDDIEGGIWNNYDFILGDEIRLDPHAKQVSVDGLYRGWGSGGPLKNGCDIQEFQVEISGGRIVAVRPAEVEQDE